MKLFVSSRYCDLLKRHGLNTFESFWNLPRHWVEDSNVRRNGWSGAIWHTVVDGEGRRFSMFVKLQENHNYRSPIHFLQWRPTFYRCLLNIRRLRRIGVPTAEPVFYGERRDGDKLQAVLVTAALDGYRELNSVFEDSSLTAGIRRAILHRIADVVWLLHCHRLQHNALSGKHLMIRVKKNDAFDLRILDLEKMRRSWSWLRTAVCDLEKLILLTPTLTTVEHNELVGHYASYLSPAYGQKLVTTINKWIARRWAAKSERVPAIRLSDSCGTPEQAVHQTPALWHFHSPSFLKYSLKKYRIPQTTYPPGKDKNKQQENPLMDFTRIAYRFRGFIGIPLFIFAFYCSWFETEWHWFIWPLGLSIFISGLLLRICAQQHLHYCLKVKKFEKYLTTTGPYAFVRNPIYLGNIIICLGAVVTSELLWLVPITFFYFFVLYSLVIRYEERHLIEKHGELYRKYMSEVPRLFPRSISFSNLEIKNEYFRASIIAEFHTIFALLPFLVKELLSNIAY